MNLEDQVVGVILQGHQLTIKRLNACGETSDHQYVVSSTTLFKAWKTKVRIFSITFGSFYIGWKVLDRLIHLIRPYLFSAV